MEVQKVFDSDSSAWLAGSSVLQQLPLQNEFYQSMTKWDSPLHRQCRCTQAGDMLLGSAVTTAFSTFSETQYMQEEEVITPLASLGVLAKPTELNWREGRSKVPPWPSLSQKLQLALKSRASKTFTTATQLESMGISVFFLILLLFYPKR